MNSDEHASLEKQLENAKSRKYTLEEQAATFGKSSVPAHIPIQIKDANEEITALEDRLNNRMPQPQAPPPPTELGVFICHAPEEYPNNSYRGLYTDLKNPKIEGLRVWFDEEQKVSSDEWEEFARKMVLTNHVVLVCLTPNTVKEGVLDQRIKFVLELIAKQPSIRVIPILLERIPIPSELQLFPVFHYKQRLGSERLLQRLAVIARELRIDVTIPLTRHLDAAMNEEVLVDQETDLLVMVRLPDSEGLRGFLGENSQYRVQPNQVKPSEFSLEFNLNEHGNLSPLDLLVEIDSPGFNPPKQHQKIAVSPFTDSLVCSFLLTPTKLGNLRVNINVFLINELYMGTNPLHIKCLSSLDTLLRPAKVIVTMSLGVFGIGKEHKKGSPLPLLLPTLAEMLHDNSVDFSPSLTDSDPLYTRNIDGTEAVPLTAKDYSKQGDKYYEQKEYQRALEAYNKAIKLDPKFARAHVWRGNVYRNLKDYTRALADYNTAIELNPNFADAYHNRGAVYRDLKDYTSALADYNTAIELDPQFTSAYNGRGNVYRNLKDYTRALADFNKSIDLDSKNAYAYNGRGNVYYDQKDYTRALADYNRAIELDPNFDWAYYNRGLVNKNLGNRDTAINDFKKAMDLGDQDAKKELKKMGYNFFDWLLEP